MMASAAWDGQDQHMAAAGDDEFNQFLDMSGMANMGDGMQFDFHGFQDSTAQPMMAQSRQHQQHDSIMADSDPSHMIPRSDGLLQNHTPAMTTAAMPAQMMATSAPSDTISSIDAQIQYLQQQKYQQQQRVLQEQRATFFSNHSHSVPPTPQSLEMAPGSGQFYSQPEQVARQGVYDRGYHQRVAEQQDVGHVPIASEPWPVAGDKSPCENVHVLTVASDGLYAPRVSCCDTFGSPLQHGQCLHCPGCLL